MTETITCVKHEMALFKSMDMKVYAGFMPLMNALVQEGFDDEFANAIVLRELNKASDVISRSEPCIIRCFCCYTADDGQARKALRIELRSKLQPSVGANVVLRPSTDTELEVVH